MPSSDRKFGFSTGAIAKGDFELAIEVIKRAGLAVVELSALREYELPKLMGALSNLDLSSFEYVSIHAPSRLSELSERDVVQLLGGAIKKEIPIVLHPDTIEDPAEWCKFGSFLLIENLDKRNSAFRTTRELHEVFARFPDAQFCLDVAHARQVDPTMGEATQMLRAFGSRLRQVHASGLNSNSTHGPLSSAASWAFSQISHLIPQDVPIILESPVSEQALGEELSFARRAFSPWLQRLRAEIDDVFDLKVAGFRHQQITSFLCLLHETGTKLSDFEHVIRQLPTGGAYKTGDMFLSTVDLLQRLSDTERADLQEYFLDRVSKVAKHFPELPKQFKQQFS
jgi:hypothetical protein